MVYNPPPYPPNMPPAYRERPMPARMSVENVTIPFVMLFAVLGVSVTGAWWAGMQFTQINNAIERLADKVASISTPINERIDRVERDLMLKTQQRWSKSDHALWCARTEQANKGWKCADPPAFTIYPPDAERPPIWDTQQDWTPRTRDKQGE